MAVKGHSMPETDNDRIMLKSETMRLVHEAVDAGEFGSTSEALEDAVRVWQRGRIENIERLDAIRERIHRSLADPRPNLTRAEVEAELERFIEERALNSRHVAR